MDKLKIFVDSAVFRLATSVKLYSSAKLNDAQLKRPDGTSEPIKVLAYQNDIDLDPNRRHALQDEISAIYKIAAIAKNEKIDLCYSHEINLELLFQPDVDLAVGRMRGAPCRIIHSPLLKTSLENFRGSDLSQFPLSIWPTCINPVDAIDIIKNEFFRLPTGCFTSNLNFRNDYIGSRAALKFDKLKASKLLRPFLEEIGEKRYLEILNLLNITGMSNAEKINNTYLDAYHLWSAECAECHYFLTTDKLLIAKFNSTPTKAVSPTTLAGMLPEVI